MCWRFVDARLRLHGMLMVAQLAQCGFCFAQSGVLALGAGCVIALYADWLICRLADAVAAIGLVFLLKASWRRGGA